MNDKQKRYETEWTFSFDSINERIRNALSSAGEEPVEESFFTPVEGATSARVKLGGMVGKHTITTVKDNQNLFEAETRSPAPVTFTADFKDGRKEVSLTGPKLKDDVLGAIKRTIGTIGKHENLFWNIRLIPTVPLELHIDGGVSQGDFDLSNLQLTRLHIGGGVGQMNIKLPVMSDTYDVKIDGGVGETVLDIPFNASANITIDGGVGNSVVRVAPGVAVRVKADGGIGGVNVPSDYKRVSSGDNFISKNGVWESEGFALAKRQVNIKFDGGVGNFTVKQGKTEVV